METEASGGLLLIVATVIALICVNSSMKDTYEHFWHAIAGFSIGSFTLEMSLTHWINDALMAIFFFVVGLEIKREIISGELSSLKKATLPAIGALGGMVVPALIYVAITYGKEGVAGWGIPMATDIAFSLGILSLLGKRVPVSLKIFLVALAIVDDLGAILVIALFYTSSLQFSYLFIGIAILFILFLLNWKRVKNPWVYGILGTIVWYYFYMSGIHATIAGVLVAFAIPIRRNMSVSEFNKKLSNVKLIKEEADSFTLSDSDIHKLDKVKKDIISVKSSVQTLEHSLHKFVNYMIIPLFALANAGVYIESDGLGDHGYISNAVMSGLFFGKSIGITLFAWLGVKLKIAELPSGVYWKNIFGVAILGGLGFTMSIFITNLAFTEHDMLTPAKIGVLGGSMLSGLIGFIFLNNTLKNRSVES